MISGFLLALLLCGMDSYLTLSFGVIEEGPTIAALFFFAFFFVSKLPITVTEMVIVSTMGSAGGSLGFIANFFAAKAMTGPAYTVFEMAAFSIVSSLVGLVMVIPLRQLLILREDLPWPGSKAVAGVIRALVEEGDPRQPKILLGAALALIVWVVGNDDGGYGLFPSETALGPLAAFGGAIAWSPFALGGSYLMGMRTCVGFLAGAAALMVMAPMLPEPAAPHRYFWPGLGFLVASGVVTIVINWRTFVGAFASILAIGEKTDDDDPVLSGRGLAILATIAFVVASAVLTTLFGLSLLLVIVLIAIGGLLQNIIATRAAAQTAFNPARVMGILLQGVTTAFGGRTVAVNLTGAGFVAGSGAQAGLLTGDMAYGRWFKVPSRYQFWAQLLTVIPCSLVAALVFEQINLARPLVLEGEGHPAPVAKMWAASAKIFDGTTPLPPGAWDALLLGGAIGVVYTLIERIKKIHPWVPDSIGVGLGLVLSPALGISFFLGGFLMWIVLGRWLKWSSVTLTTVAVASIVAEGLGGVLKPLLAELGLGL
ncbi:MAG: OPT/YSL family transporter [Nannocystaceae bacterium]